MKPRFLAQAGVVAALYALLTVLVAPISSGLIQCRVSEALCVLPYFMPAAVPGLFVGCVIANLLMGAPVYDVVFGSLATLLAALCAYGVRRHGLSKYLVPLPAILWNALIVGALFVTVYALPVGYPLAVLYVAAGQAVACYGLGLPLMAALERFGGKLL